MGYPVGVREVVLARVAAGEAGSAVGRDLGIGHATVTRWANLAGMTLQMGRLGGVAGVSEYRRKPVPVRPVPVLPTGEWVDAAGRLTAAGRVVIEIRLGDGWSQTEIASMVGVHRSTISREVRRCPSVRYRARIAQKAHLVALKRPKVGKLPAGSLLRRVVRAGLYHGLSPQQISGRLRDLHGHREDMQVSHETIYRALYVQGAGGLRHELSVEKALRSGRTSRLPRSKLSARRSNRSWIGDATITARPAEAADRAIPGHWEGDLIIGTDLTSALVTLNERSSRYLLLGRLDMHDSITVTDQLKTMIARLPKAQMVTLTWDQGVEMARHDRLTIDSDVKVFFCDPHSPWQRPTNENSNGLIRQYFPKSTNFSKVTDAQVAEVETLLNTRPRAVLDFRTPAERLQQQIKVALTT